MTEGKRCLLGLGIWRELDNEFYSANIWGTSYPEANQHHSHCCLPVHSPVLERQAGQVNTAFKIGGGHTVMKQGVEARGDVSEVATVNRWCQRPVEHGQGSDVLCRRGRGITQGGGP